MTLYYGNVPVPFTASWSSEEDMTIAPCRYAGARPAVCQSISPGVGRPLFAKPHMVRQRQAMALDLCDLCGRPLKGRTKVSLSHASLRFNAAEGSAVLQVEPLLHRECAAVSVRHCPSLQRDIAEGRLDVRRVTRSRVQLAQLTGAATMEFCGVNRPGTVGHAKIDILSSVSMPLEWLQGAGSS